MKRTVANAAATVMGALLICLGGWAGMWLISGIITLLGI